MPRLAIGRFSDSTPPPVWLEALRVKGVTGDESRLSATCNSLIYEPNGSKVVAEGERGLLM